MEFKKKIKTLLQKEGFQKVQKVLSPTSHRGSQGDFNSSSIVPAIQQFRTITRDPETELRNHPSDPEADEAILNSINSSFFSGEGFDPSLCELEKLPEPIDREYIQSARQRVLRELTVVSKKVFQLILDKQSNYTGEIQRMREIEDELEAALFVCKESRSDLYIAKQHFTTKSLGILANYRKRQSALKLLTSLKTIDTLQRTEHRLRELLLEEDFPGAIQLLLECQQAAVTYNHFTCISDLSKKLQETLENAEEQMDVALSKICLNFNHGHYCRLQKAYQLLGKTQTCMDQLLMHYASAIHNTAFSVLHGFAELCRTEDIVGSLQKRQYQDLCSSLTPDIFIPCLIELCKALWKIIVSYHRLALWHKSEEPLGDVNNIMSPSKYCDVDREYIEQKLHHGAIHIWQDVQTKVKTFLLAVDFTGFKIDDFMQILCVLHSLQKIGQEFCNSDSESLQDCIKQASLRYFQKYHDAKIDELRIFIESEGWQVCPVRQDFELVQLMEFKFLKLENFKIASEKLHLASVSESVFDKESSPFDLKKEESEEDIYLLNESNQNKNNEEECGKTFDEDTHDAPIITNTSLSILRLFGRYLHLMNLLKSISYDVAVSMSHLFEYYLYSVFVLFASENGGVPIDAISNAQLRVALSRIRDNLIRSDSDSKPTPGKVLLPNFHIPVDLADENKLFGLHEKVVASESCVFLALQLDKVKPVMELYVSPSQWESVAQLIDQAVIVSTELRKPIFAGISCKVIDYQNIAMQIEKVNWEVKDLATQHSNYVDVLLRGLQVFAMRLSALNESLMTPREVQAVLWEQIFKFCCRVFVDGFGNIKKCSNAGRGLMQLDFIQFLSKLEKMVPIPLKSLPDKEYVESYIKAYYMPDTIMEEWIQSHTEYSSRQLVTLVTCALQGNKKSKQKLLTLIEDMDKLRK